MPGIHAGHGKGVPRSDSSELSHATTFYRLLHLYQNNGKKGREEEKEVSTRGGAAA